MLAGELLWLCPQNVLCLGSNNLSEVLFVLQDPWANDWCLHMHPMQARSLPFFQALCHTPHTHGHTPQPRWGTLLRRWVTGFHQTLEFCCWQDTWKTESQLLISCMRNPKPREMKELSQDQTAHSRLADSQASSLLWSHTASHSWTSLTWFCFTGENWSKCTSKMPRLW